MTEPHAVFVVDDEPPIRSMLQRLLRRSGYDVQCYATAAEARTALLRASFDAEPVDCVLLDMALEHDSNDTREAEALLEELTHRLPTPGVLLMSGQLSHNEFFRLVMRGATDFVAKPWDPSELLSRVRKCSEIGRGRYLHHHGLSSELPEEPRDAFLSYA
jgi:DNA-binding NtrC family response regulator